MLSKSTRGRKRLQMLSGISSTAHEALEQEAGQKSRWQKRCHKQKTQRTNTNVLRRKLELNLPTRLKSVAALPGEIDLHLRKNKSSTLLWPTGDNVWSIK